MGLLYEEDLIEIANCSFIPWDKLKGKTILITGGTGLIGSTLIRGILYFNSKNSFGIKIVALVRDMNKAEKIFHNEMGAGISFVSGCVEELPDICEPIDYIIHGAGNTVSKLFVEQPVETVRTAVLGTENLLKLAVNKRVKGFVFLSSMEVYGYPERGHKVSEKEIGSLSPLNVRNSYPISKQLCEALTCAYSKEYGIKANIIRLTQTFGAGISKTDNRIFAYFVRCAVEKKDIVLKTKGETERSYLYTSDAVTAILMVLLCGESGQAYNASNEETYCSIAKMANTVAKQAGVGVKYEIDNNEMNGFADTLYMDLDTSCLKKLGWKPSVESIEEMYRRAIKAYV